MPSAIMMVWLTPSMIDGFASGTWTIRRRCRAVDPNASATSSEVVGTSRMPNAVNRIAGGIANAKVAISAGASPMPNSNTNGSRYEYAGIVCIASKIGRKHSFHPLPATGPDPERDADRQSQHHGNEHQRQRLDGRVPYSQQTETQESGCRQ